MLHLSTDRLAALVDDGPTPVEMAHLAHCPECAQERKAYQRLASLASSDANRIGVPLTTWERLAPALVADGVIDNGRDFQFRTRRSYRPWLQAAAAVLLVAGGVMGGRFTAGATVLPIHDQSPSARVMDTASDSEIRFASADDARAMQERSQAMYQAAAAFLAQQGPSERGAETPSAMKTRLAALDRVREVVGKALNEAPYDQVINDLLVATAGQREATLRQLNTSLPAGMRLISY
jgi:hypothetical protein